jgi:hypothetical protein
MVFRLEGTMGTPNCRQALNPSRTAFTMTATAF